MRTMGRKGRSRGRYDKAMSHGAAVGFAGANRGSTPRVQALGDAINAATGARRVIDDETLPIRMVDMMRDPRDDVGFGPGHPLAPAPIDPSRPDTKRPEPRLTEYPVSWNLPGNADAPMPWATLRAAAANVDIMRRCISVRKEQLQGLDWSITLDDQVVQGMYAASDGSQGRADIEAELRRKLLPEIDRLTTFMRNPWASNGVSFEQWVNGIMEDHLVLDAVAVYPRVTYGGDVTAFELIDATTIKLLIDYRGARPAAPYPAFQQVLYGFPRAEFSACAYEETDPATGQTREIVEPGLTADQLWYFREEYRTFTPYGYSAVQQALISARLYLKRQGWMIAEYDDGSTPLTFLVPDGTDATLVEKLTPRTRRQWEDSINDELTGQTRARNRMKVLMPGMVPHQMAGVDERYKPDYDMHLIKMLAGHFGVTSSGLGFSESKGLGNSGLHEGQERVQDSATTKPDKRMIERIVNELMCQFLKAPAELKFKFNDANNTEDAAAEDTARNSQRERGALTLNEDRRAAGKAPLPFKEADMALVKVGDGWMPLDGMAAKLEEVHAAEQQALAATQKADEAAVDGEEPTGEDAAKSLELSAYRRWARRRGDDARRPFECETLEPADFTKGVPLDVVFSEWEWVPEGLADDVEVGDIAKAFGGNDNWRTLARDSKGRWVKRGSMRVGSLGPSSPDKPVLAGLRRDAERRRAASAPAAPNLSGVNEKELLGMSRRGEPGARAEVARRKAGGTLAHVDRKPDRTWEEEAQWSKPERQLPVSDSSSTIGGMTTPKPKASKRLPDAQHNAVQSIAERYAHNVATLDTASTSPMVDAADLGIRPATADALVKAGILDRQMLYGFQRRYRLTDAGHAYLAEHSGDTRRAELTAGIADLETQRDALNANRTAYDPDATNLSATVNRQSRQAGDQQDRMLMDQANAMRAERAKLPVQRPAALPPVASRTERAAALRAGAASMLSGTAAPTSMGERIRARQEKDVREAVGALQRDPGAWVAMADLRRELDRRGLDRGQQDAVLRRMATEGDRSLNLAPEDNQKTLTSIDHAAAIDLGAGPQHIVSIDPPRPAIAPLRGDDDLVDDIEARGAGVSGGRVSLAQLRQTMGGTREEQDAALKRLDRARVIILDPDPNRKAIPQEGHDAAISIGGEPKHLVSILNGRSNRVRESDEQAARASAVIDSVPGLREGVARQQGGASPDVIAREYDETAQRWDAIGRADLAELARGHARDVRARGSSADPELTAVRPEGRQNNVGHAPPSTPPGDVNAPAAETRREYLANARAVSAGMRAKRDARQAAERTEAAAAPTPAPDKTPVPAAEAGRAAPTARSVTGIERAAPERQAALRETARKLDERHAAFWESNRAEMERDIASERGFLARTDLDDAERKQHETMLAGLEALSRTPRGDAAVQATKGARELLGLADAQGMIVMVSHSSSNGAGGGSPYFDIQAVSPDMKTGFKATFHTFKGKNGSYGRMRSEVIKDGRASDASLTAIREHVTNANKPVATVETAAPRNVDPSIKVPTSDVQQGDWRWNSAGKEWEQIGMIETAKPYAQRVIWGPDRDTKLGTLGHGQEHIIARQAERPTLPPRSEGLKGLQRKAGEPAKRGDVYVVERTDNSYIGGGAANANRKAYEVYEVTSVTREGKPRAVRRMTQDPGDGFEQKMDQFGSLGRSMGYGTSSVIPGDKIDKEGLTADLRARTYKGSTTPRHHDDLRELGDVLYGRMKVAERPATPAPKPATPAAAPSINDMMAANMASSVANPSEFGAAHGKVTNDQITAGTRLAFNGTAWEVLEKPRKARADAKGREGKVFRARREDQGIESTMRLNDGATAALAAPKGEQSRPKADAASAAPLTGDAALAAAPKDVEATGARGIDAKGAAAIERYRGKSFTEINAKLRAGGAPDATVQQIDRVMDESKLTRPIVTHRAIGDVGAVFGAAAGRKLDGHEWTDAAPQSTSTVQDKADTFLATGGNRRTAARIVMRVPAGVGAVQLSDGRYEAELLLQRGLRMRVVSDTGPWRRGQKNPRTIEVEVIPA